MLKKHATTFGERVFLISAWKYSAYLYAQDDCTARTREKEYYFLSIFWEPQSQTSCLMELPTLKSLGELLVLYGRAVLKIINSE